LSVLDDWERHWPNGWTRLDIASPKSSLGQVNGRWRMLGRWLKNFVRKLQASVKRKSKQIWFGSACLMKRFHAPRMHFPAVNGLAKLPSIPAAC